MSVSLSLNHNISLDFIDKLVATKTPRKNDILVPNSEKVANNPETTLSEEMLFLDSNQMPYGNQENVNERFHDNKTFAFGL
mmetsp:Transcript_51975/g.63637  ORF Transcript_51975/g.63637 Transcript_51975/m.63637 type:complete len:81 (+) Transcript_51975:27-269(+)